MYYIYAPFLYLFNYNPIAGGIVEILLSLSAVFVTYRIGRRFINIRVGLLAAFFIAASPLLVKFSRQNLLAFSPLIFSAVSLYVLLLLAKQYRWYYAAFLGFILGVALQVHYSTLSLFVAAALFPIFFFTTRQKTTYFLTLLIGFLVGFFPLLLFEFRHEFFNTKMLVAHISRGESETIEIGRSVLYLVDAVSQYFFGGKIILTVVAISLLLFFLHLQKKRLTRNEAVFLLQIVGTILFVIFFVRQTVPHYIINAVIPFALLFSTVLDRILYSSKRIFAYFLFAMMYFLISFSSYGFGDVNGWTMDPGWNLPGVEKASRIIFEDVTVTDFNLVMLVDAENQGYPLRYFLTVWGKQPLPVEQYDTPQHLYVVARSHEDLTKVQLFEVTSFGAFTIEKTWDIQGNYRLYRLGKAAV